MHSVSKILTAKLWRIKNMKIKANLKWPKPKRQLPMKKQLLNPMVKQMLHLLTVIKHSRSKLKHRPQRQSQLLTMVPRRHQQLVNNRTMKRHQPSSE